MSRFAELMQHSSVAIDRHLSDCVVTIGNTVGLASSLRPPLCSEAVYQDDSNLKVRGMFESPFVVGLDREGYEITISVETPIPLENTQNIPMLRRNDRLLVESDADDRPGVQRVYGIKSVQPDGQWRVLLHLSLMGPLCETAEEYVGLPMAFPVVLGSKTYEHCINLNGGPAFKVDGKFIE